MMAKSIRRSLTALALSAALVVPAALTVGCSASGDLPEPTALPDKTQKVSVYFSTGRSLTEERRIVDADDLYAATLTELLKADPENEKQAVVQPVADFNSVTLEDGLLTVDWEKAVLDFEAEDEEYVIAWGAFILTFGQFPQVERLAFTVEGKAEGTIDGKDIAEFWGSVTLKDQPWDVQRPPGYVDPSAEESGTAEPTKTAEPTS